METPKYRAFLSYRTTSPDNEVAFAVHRALERYRTPRKLVSRGIRANVGRIFLAPEEADASRDLVKMLKSALAESEFLIVICSPAAASSSYVNGEIAWFCNTPRRDQILAVLADGQPPEAFPPALLQPPDAGGEAHQQIPVAADLRVPPTTGWESRLPAFLERRVWRGRMHRRLRVEKLRLLARLLKCDFDDLRQRHHQRLVRRLAALAVGLAVMVAVLVGLTLYAIAQRDRAEGRLQAAIDLLWFTNSAIENKLRQSVVTGGLGESPIRNPAEYKTMLPSDPDASIFSLTYGTLGALTNLVGWPEETEQFYRRAIAAVEGSTAPSAEKKEFRVGFSSVLEKWGDDSVDREAFDEAARAYALAAELLDRQLMEAASDPDVRFARALLTGKTGDVADRRGNRQESGKLHRQAHDVFAQLAADRPDDKNICAALSLSQEKIATFAMGLKPGDGSPRYQEALEYFERALQHRVCVASLPDGRDRYADEASQLHLKIAYLHVRARRPDDAVRHVSASMTLIDELLARNPGDSRLVARRRFAAEQLAIAQSAVSAR